MTCRKSSANDGSVPPSPEAPAVVVAGSIRLLVDSCEAYVHERPVALSPTECRILRVLLEQHPRVVTRTALMVAAWGIAQVESITKLAGEIDVLRARLGDDVKIETVTGIGYRLL
jgi:DNA-binding response OmpR family regulator